MLPDATARRTCVGQPKKIDQLLATIHRVSKICLGNNETFLLWIDEWTHTTRPHQRGVPKFVGSDGVHTYMNTSKSLWVCMSVCVCGGGLKRHTQFWHMTTRKRNCKLSDNNIRMLRHLKPRGYEKTARWLETQKDSRNAYKKSEHPNPAHVVWIIIVCIITKEIKKWHWLFTEPRLETEHSDIE